MPIDYRLYPSNWLTEIRPAILERAGNRCEKCGLPNGLRGYRHGDEFIVTLDDEDAPRGHKILRIVLTVAHLDHDPANCDPANLRAWCQRCHLRHDARLHARHAAETRRRKRYAGQLELTA